MHCHSAEVKEQKTREMFNMETSQNYEELKKNEMELVFGIIAIKKKWKNIFSHIYLVG